MSVVRSVMALEVGAFAEFLDDLLTFPCKWQSL